MEILIHFVIPLEAMFSSTSISFVILQACHEILQLFQIHKMSLFHPEKSISAISFSDGSSCFPFIISKLISYFSHNPCSKISYFRSTIRYIESPFYIPIEYPFLLCFRSCQLTVSSLPSDHSSALRLLPPQVTVSTVASCHFPFLCFIKLKLLSFSFCIYYINFPIYPQYQELFSYIFSYS